jgi:Mce-associated membrane protein
MPTPRGPEQADERDPADRGARPDKADTTVVVKKKPPRAVEAPSAPRRQLPVDLLATQRRLDRLRWIPAVLAGLAVVAVLVVGAWQSDGVWWGKRLHDNRTQQQQQVLAAAKSCTAAILSYDYRQLDSADKAATACITPDFKTQYEQTFSVVKQLAPQKKAILTFQVENGGVQSVSKDGKQWVVLLYAQTGYADSSTPKDTPRLDISTPVVTLTEVGGKWLVSNMNTTG